MIYDFLVDDFKNNFRPIFRSKGTITLVFLGDEPILEKNETSQEYKFLKDYPEEIKTFILKEVAKTLKPKFFLATYNTETKEIKTSQGFEISKFTIPHNHLMNLYLFLEVQNIDGIVVRLDDDTYEFRPVIEEANYGFNLKMKTKLTFDFINKHYPELLSDDYLNFTKGI